ncbi:MAG: hypothetical protein IJ415_02510 [Clostridia bacterium]|nr:hypothetical protein [Clostridia bacterium]
MNYLISTFDCVIFANKFFEIKENVKYKLTEKGHNKAMVFSNANTIPFILDLQNLCEEVLKVKYGFDTFYFLFPNYYFNFFSTIINFKNKLVNVSLSSKLIITIDGVLTCDETVKNLSYSHYEIMNDLCLIYFTGARDYVVILKGNELCFASYYDECNIKDNEKYFMCKLKDSLNHGKVCQIKDKEVSSYLVYLDDEDLNLKDVFLPIVFMDCVKAENYKYCNNLLSESLKMQDEKGIKNFFPTFDFCYPIDESKVILINKNTLAGIYAFEIQNNLIVNITEC